MKRIIEDLIKKQTHILSVKKRAEEQIEKLEMEIEIERDTVKKCDAHHSELLQAIEKLKS